ncbi:GGDEF domain-containing protein [Sanguibacter suaedae]|uniref:GGDEF domain-containing protein n=1 Tax=Sanguibacter suaedae TaxID=2795737 RepID=A0A934M7X9_9MICO|nr:GGDEF domain-containing protein [Sanguibacter suaedae]MBI9115917.1 GGDEF domain-containing protein [Sanguibacter suaedae]
MSEPTCLDGRALHLGLAATALTLVIAHSVTDGVIAALVFLLSTLAPAVAVLWVLRTRTPPDPRPWWFVVGSLVVLSVNNVSRAVHVAVAGEDAPEAGLMQLVNHVTIPVGYLGLFVASLLVVVPIARGDGGKIVDAAIMSVAGAGLLWTFVLGPALDARESPPSVRVYTLFVVLVACAMTGAVGRSLVAAVHARTTLAYLLLAACATLLGSVATTTSANTVTGVVPGWVDAAWIVAYLSVGAAVVHPASMFLASPGRPGSRKFTRQHLAFLGVALSLNPALAAVREIAGYPTDALILALSSLLLVPLVLVRVSQLARLHAQAQEDLVHQATHDALTGLPNRRIVDTHLEEVLRRVDDGELPGAVVCFIDLNDFKIVNDEFGHHVGDNLLVAVTRRLRDAVRAGDFIARFGGDEFVLVLTGNPEHLEATTVSRIHAALEPPITVGPLTARASTSIGAVTVRPGAHLTADQLLSLADARMYVDKRRRHSATGQPLR